MKKGLITLGGAALLAVAVASCGSKTKRVAFVGMPGVSEYFIQMQDEFKKQFKAKGLNADDVNGDFDPTKQVQQAELFLDNNPDYLFIWPNNPETMNNVVKKAHEQGTKVISFVEEIADSDAYIVTDPRELAQQSAEIASAWINTKYPTVEAKSLKVAVVYDSSKTNVVWQGESMRDYIKTNEKVGTVDFISCAEGADKGKAWAELSGSQYDVVLSPNCSTAMGISQSFLEDEARNKDLTGIFTVNVQSADDIAKVASSKTNACLVRGAANAGNGADGTIADFVKVYEALEAGAEKGLRQLSINTYLYEDQFRGAVNQIAFA